MKRKDITKYYGQTIWQRFRFGLVVLVCVALLLFALQLCGVETYQGTF